MNYDFPTIKHIDDVLPHIEGVDEFKVIRKDWYIVVNYVVAFGETFDWDDNDPEGSAMRRECRGLIFDSESGKLLSRPYHKFFNVGERPEMPIDSVDLSAYHVVLEKLDGCCEANTELITPDGVKTIKEVCDSKYYGLVLGYDHDNSEYCWTPILSHSEKPNNNDWYEIELENKEKIILTSNHKIWCLNKNSYVEVGSLFPGDEVLLVP